MVKVKELKTKCSFNGIFVRTHGKNRVRTLNRKVPSISDDTGDPIGSLLLVPVFEDEFVEVGLLLCGVHCCLVTSVYVAYG